MENEKEVLGFSLRFHPFANYISKIDYKYFNNLLELDKLEDKYEFSIPAVITKIYESMTKKNTPMITLNVIDLFTESAFYITAKNQIEKYRDMLNEQTAILIKGKREKSRFNDRIYNNIIEIKELDAYLENKNLKEVKRTVKTNDFENAAPVKQIKVENNNSENPFKNKETNLKVSDNNYNFIKNSNSGKKQLSLYMNKNIFDDMDLLCLQNAISSNPGDYTIFLKLKSESGTEIFKIGEDYKVEPNARFFNEAKNSLRSLIEIEYA